MSVPPRFDFGDGPSRGSHLELERACLVHRAASYVEAFPLGAVASVRAEFARDTRRVGWGMVLVILAVVLQSAAAPLAGVAEAAAAEVTGSPSGVGSALLAVFRSLELLARILPFAAAAAALGGIALGVAGWFGATTLTIASAGGERTFRVRGRNAALLDFADAVVAALPAPGR